jgi:hypothetical protein
MTTRHKIFGLELKKILGWGSSFAARTIDQREGLPKAKFAKHHRRLFGSNLGLPMQINREAWPRLRGDRQSI